MAWYRNRDYFLMVGIILLLFLMMIIFRTQLKPLSFEYQLNNITHGLLDNGFVRKYLTFGILISLIIICARKRLSLGEQFTLDKLVKGTVFFLILLIIVDSSFFFITGNSLIITLIDMGGQAQKISILSADIFLNAFVEEFVFRMYIIGVIINFNRNSRKRKAIAVLLSTILFASIHVSFFNHASTIEWIIFLLAPVLLGYLYIVTENILIAVGYHVVLNCPGEFSLDGGNVFIGLVFLVGFVFILLYGVIKEFSYFKL